MKQLSICNIISAAAIATACFVAFAPAAQAGEYCTTNISGMRGCPYDTMEQCQATIAGGGGPCYRDPFLPPETKSNAMGYAPKHVPAHKRVKH